MNPLYKLQPHRHLLPDCLTLTQDSLALLFRLITCCRFCLPLSNLPRLIPGKLTCLPSPTLRFFRCLLEYFFGCGCLVKTLHFYPTLWVFYSASLWLLGDPRLSLWFLTCSCEYTVYIFTCWHSPSRAHCLLSTACYCSPFFSWLQVYWGKVFCTPSNDTA